jgi:hypothetical protein
MKGKGVVFIIFEVIQRSNDKSIEERKGKNDYVKRKIF